MARKKGVPQRAGLSRAEFEQVKALTSSAFEQEQRDEEERRRRLEADDRRRAEEHVKRIRAAAEERNRAAQQRGALASSVVAPLVDLAHPWTHFITLNSDRDPQQRCGLRFTLRKAHTG